MLARTLPCLGAAVPRVTAGNPAMRRLVSGHHDAAATKKDFGQLKRLKVLCISEIGWLDNNTLLHDFKNAGGMHVNQYKVGFTPFGDIHPDNARGASQLIEAETLDGVVHRSLYDVGWNHSFIRQRFEEEGVDKLLRNNEIEQIIISHEHFDHFWGLPVALECCPSIKIRIPDGFSQEGLDFIAKSGHTGELEVVRVGDPVQIFPGAVVVNSPTAPMLGVENENVLYFYIKNKGLALVTGCGHGGILNLLDYACEHLAPEERVHAVYGGLHIAPFEDWDEGKDKIIEAMKGYNVERWCCNHCTGKVAAEKMKEAGLRVEGGSGLKGSQTKLFLGNGDALELSAN